MSDGTVTPDVLAWVGQVRPGASVISSTVRPLTGGDVSGRVEQVTLHLTGGGEPLELVSKEVPGHEVAGLRAAQAVRPGATAVPELVASGTGWLITPLAPGSPLAWGDALPENVVDSLAALHARYHGGAGLADSIPRVTPRGGRRCAGTGSIHNSASAPSAIRGKPSHGPGHSSARPPALRQHPRCWPGWSRPCCTAMSTTAMSWRTGTDWGSSRVGPAALDLANLVPTGSAGAARYAQIWQQLTGRPVPDGAAELGYRWAVLQIPVQYLPWSAAHLPTSAVETALDRIEQALDQLQI